MELGDQGSQGGGASLAPGTVVLSNLLGFSFQHPRVWTAPRFPLSLLAHSPSSRKQPGWEGHRVMVLNFPDLISFPAWIVLLPHEGILGIKVKLFLRLRSLCPGSLSGSSTRRDI